MFTQQKQTPSYFLRVVWIVLLAVTCLRVWSGPLDPSPVAHAQVPDSGRQRLELLEEVRRTNVLLAEIRLILTSGTLKVRSIAADKPGTDN